MEFQNILYHVDKQIAYITINRESKLNALNQLTLEELEASLTSAKGDANVKGVIITGTGDKAFVAGADIKEFVELGQLEAKKLSEKGHYIFTELIQNSKKPVIAAINGFALGGGLELALACHMRFASENAKLGLPEVSLGLLPGYGGTQRLTRLVGRGRALQMILTADMINAEEGLRIGLINEVLPLEDLLKRASEVMSRIFSRSSTAVEAAIDAMNACDDQTRDGYEVEIEHFAHLFLTDDFKEGVAAFLEKRKPNF
ncbi:enoyl-CoA hydratase-related protein [Sphingobacterium sp. SRCM116780]|uniref:enoyl-CoA hydratase/isomerase family protein n=1 Tax=Sphingobacterium sp. SRCM116780 TaxID=2907623 RepID=UPI001F200DD0|nr:enoyl-CoA hydratase-related protein [Sphingobacterium sp. SRCM116780]UIR55879.1 enoyl-CoA hydratase-related protein [Sphingobacterium sp. SRCM116780]